MALLAPAIKYYYESNQRQKLILITILKIVENVIWTYADGDSNSGEKAVNDNHESVGRCDGDRRQRDIRLRVLKAH